MILGGGFFISVYGGWGIFIFVYGGVGSFGVCNVWFWGEFRVKGDRLRLMLGRCFEELLRFEEGSFGGFGWVVFFLEKLLLFMLSLYILKLVRMEFLIVFLIFCRRLFRKLLIRFSFRLGYFKSFFLVGFGFWFLEILRFICFSVFVVNWVFFFLLI